MTDIIVAANLASMDELKAFVKKTSRHLNYYKIDSGLFTKTGPDAIKLIKDAGRKIFLDLKFHDIPSTVARAAADCIELGVDMFNVHAMGGFEMMPQSRKRGACMMELLSFLELPYLLPLTRLLSGIFSVRRQTVSTNTLSCSPSLQKAPVFRAWLLRQTK